MTTCQGQQRHSCRHWLTGSQSLCKSMGWRDWWCQHDCCVIVVVVDGCFYVLNVVNDGIMSTEASTGSSERREGWREKIVSRPGMYQGMCVCVGLGVTWVEFCLGSV